MRTTALLVLALWAPASMHCLLEALPGCEFLVCCEESGGQPHQDQDCKEDACAVVESGDYRVEDYGAAVLPPLFSVVCVAQPLATDLTSVHKPACEISPAPPDLPTAWLFQTRAALPPRAPDVRA